MPISQRYQIVILRLRRIESNEWNAVLCPALVAVGVVLDRLIAVSQGG